MLIPPVILDSIPLRVAFTTATIHPAESGEVLTRLPIPAPLHPGYFW
jgi:hypothetical protein